MSTPLAGLRHRIAALESPGNRAAGGRFGLGLPALDQALGGGLPRGAVHEAFAAGIADAPAAFGFGLALALRAAEGRRIVWVRQDMAALESGELYPPGLAAFGADPSDFILVRVHDALQALRAGHEALRCAALGAVVIEPFGATKAFDLTASRRLALAAAQAEVPAFVVRAGAEPEPSAAFSRWNVRTSPSRALAADAPGFPVFDLSLLRHRAGLPPQRFRVEWNRDQCVFRAPALSRAVAASASRRAAAPGKATLRRTG